MSKLLKTIFLCLTASIAKPDLLNLYSFYKYPIEVTNQHLIVSYPFTHALIERMLHKLDHFFFGLIYLVHLSQSSEDAHSTLITIECRLALSNDKEDEIGKLKNELYPKKWWLYKKF